MQATCVRHTDLPHTSRLFRDYIYDFPRVSAFYDWRPQRREDFAAAAARIEFPAERRAALVSALRAMNGGHAALDTLARPGTFAVITGQQVGLFTGPIYTIYKALTAVALAGQLTAAGLPAVPVFWLATEDHDFDEANHCWVFDTSNRPVRLAIDAAGAPGAGRGPVGGIPVAAPPIDALRRALSGLPFVDEVTDAVAAAYTPGSSMGSAFAALLARVLPTPMLVFDPMHPNARRLAAPLLRKAVENMPDLNAAVRKRGRELETDGYHAQVLVEEGTSFVFLLENGRRIALRRDGADFLAGDRRISASELAARAEQLSPNALLRPVVQDSMFPTVAYIGGPAELAYFAQSQPLYRALLGRMPVAVPRQSATLLDSRAQRLFDRYGLALPDLLHGEEALRDRIAAVLVPEDVKAVIADARQRAAGIFDSLGATLARFDRSLESAFAKSRRKMEYQLAKTERKVARAALMRDERAASEAAYLSGLVYPEKHLQERFYSVLPFLARHGMDLAGRLAEALAPECADHRVIPL
ncbi:MAG: bacillithiol biosynthesis cysteine-adding enzyme BshC [bacterium]|jgi:bacillithiol biosynthesis cysteine-adding enzyme BshC